MLLDLALTRAGLEAVKGSTIGGNLAEWRPVSGVELVGNLLARKIVVRLRETPAEQRNEAMVRTLRVLRKDESA